MPSVSQEIVDKLSKISAATLHEALGKKGELPVAIRPLSPTTKVCGRAFTVACLPGDNLGLHHAIVQAQAGDVLIAKTANFYDSGYWGEILTVGAMERGIVGLVIDACIRDADPIEALGFPVFCRGLCLRGTTKNGKGDLNGTITIGDVIINGGDIVVGDRDGVVVIPSSLAEETLKKAIAREEKEAQTFEQLRAGKTTLEIYDWD